MTAARRRLSSILGALFSVKQDVPEEFPGLLGTYLNGEKTVAVAGRPTFVWVRVRGSQSELVQAYNDTVAEVYDLPVLIVRDTSQPNYYRVKGRNVAQYANWGSSNPRTRTHALTHMHSDESGAGTDVVWVMQRQFMPMLLTPQPTGSMSAFVEPAWYEAPDGYRYFGGTGTVDMSSLRPTNPQARFATVYIDFVSGNPVILTGSLFNVGSPEGVGVLVPMPTKSQGWPVGSVYFLSGTVSIDFDSLYDSRAIVGSSGLVQNELIARMWMGL
jgi:hypothetical protein